MSVSAGKVKYQHGMLKEALMDPPGGTAPYLFFPRMTPPFSQSLTLLVFLEHPLFLKMIVLFENLDLKKKFDILLKWCKPISNQTK